MPHRYTIISPRRAGCRMAGHITTDHRLNITICQNGAAPRRYPITALDSACWTANTPFARLTRCPFFLLMTLLFISLCLPHSAQENSMPAFIIIAAIEAIALYAQWAPIHYLDLTFADGKTITIKAPLAFATGLTVRSTAIYTFGRFFEKEIGSINMDAYYNFTIQETGKETQYYPLAALQNAQWKDSKSGSAPYAISIKGHIMIFIMFYAIFFILPVLSGSYRFPTLIEAFFYALLMLIFVSLQKTGYFLILSFADGKTCTVNIPPAFARHLRIRKPELTLPA